MDSQAQQWETHAREWAAWARRPGHDSYWAFHREAFLKLLPPPGRLTVDAGCGEGRVARDLASLGHRVVAVDRSPTLARMAAEAGGGIAVVLADAARLPLPATCADLAIAFMSLQDMDDMPGAVAELGRVLTPGGRLCLAVVHPINSSGEFESAEPDARFIIAGDYLEERRYSDTVARDGLTMTFHQRHRSLHGYFAPLEAAGLLVEAVREPAPGRAGRWDRVPLFLQIRALKPPAAG